MCSGWCNNWVTRQHARCNNKNRDDLVRFSFFSSLQCTTLIFCMAAKLCNISSHSCWITTTIYALRLALEHLLAFCSASPKHRTNDLSSSVAKLALNLNWHTRSLSSLKFICSINGFHERISDSAVWLHTHYGTLLRNVNWRQHGGLQALLRCKVENIQLRDSV